MVCHQYIEKPDEEAVLLLVRVKEETCDNIDPYALSTFTRGFQRYILLPTSYEESNNIPCRFVFDFQNKTLYI